jgi:hypothetical protein
MHFVRARMWIVASFLGASLFPQAVFAGGGQGGPKITVTNVRPTTVSGGNTTVTAGVTVTDLPDGIYTVNISITNQTAGTDGELSTGVVVISGGTGTVSVVATNPAGNPPDQGILAVEVIDDGSGTSGAGSVGIVWN